MLVGHSSDTNIRMSEIARLVYTSKVYCCGWRNFFFVFILFILFILFYFICIFKFTFILLFYLNTTFYFLCILLSLHWHCFLARFTWQNSDYLDLPEESEIEFGTDYEFDAHGWEGTGFGTDFQSDAIDDNDNDGKDKDEDEEDSSYNIQDDESQLEADMKIDQDMSLSVNAGDSDGENEADGDGDNESNVVLGVEMALEMENEVKSDILPEMPGILFFCLLGRCFCVFP